MKTRHVIYVIGVLFSCNVFAVGGDYKFGPLVQQNCSVNDIRLQKKLHYEMDQFFDTAYYDRTVYYLESVLKPMTADLANNFNQCHFNSKKMFKKYGSANCVGMAQYYQEVLSRKSYYKENSNIPTPLPRFQTISSTERASAIQPKMPDYPHLALVAWCEDGYILVDPSLNIPAPIFLEEGKPSSLDMKFRGTWKFELDLSKDTDRRIKVSADSSDSNKPWTDQQKSNATYSYLLKENQNGDESITSQYFLADRKVLIFRLNTSDTNAYRVTLNLIKKQIECTETEPSGNVKAIFTLPFADYLKNPELLENLVDQKSVATELRMDRDTLLERIRTVIERSN